jgi:hypothetical protein
MTINNATKKLRISQQISTIVQKVCPGGKTGRFIRHEQDVRPLPWNRLPKAECLDASTMCRNCECSALI